jgi:hypothetical protein
MQPVSEFTTRLDWKQLGDWSNSDLGKGALKTDSPAVPRSTLFHKFQAFHSRQCRSH